jgi:magnesium transporter
MRLENYGPVIQELLRAMGKGGRVLDLDAVRRALEGIHPNDIAQILDELTLPEAIVVFNCIDDERAAEVLAETSQETNRYLIEHAPRERIVALLGQMDMDDAAEVVAEAGDEAEPLLQDMGREFAGDVESLLAYPERTAGRLMTGRFAVVQANTSAGLTLEYLRQNAPVLETINVIYIASGAGQLGGVCSIRDLIVAKPATPVRSIMAPEPISVTPETDQQEVARIISQYDLLAVPVVDHMGRIVGIVTVDDVIDVLVEEFEEDIAKLVGTDADEMERRTPVQVAKLRLPWILATMFIELFAGVVIHAFDKTLTKFILLASFMPIISALSGNTGLQSAAIVIRGLSTGHVQLSQWKRVVVRQFTTTAILGFVCAVLLGAIGAIWDHHWAFGLTVFLGMFLAINIAGIVGTMVPLISKRFGFDPALTAGPFETAFQDVVGITIFLSLASVLLNLFHVGR